MCQIYWKVNYQGIRWFPSLQDVTSTDILGLIAEVCRNQKYRDVRTTSTWTTSNSMLDVLLRSLFFICTLKPKPKYPEMENKEGLKYLKYIGVTTSTNYQRVQAQARIMRGQRHSKASQGAA